MIGSKTTHNIYSLSNDGKMCIWRPNFLMDPRQHFTLEVPENAKPAGRHGDGMMSSTQS